MNMDALTTDFLFVGDENPPVVGSADGSMWRSYVSGQGSPSVLTDDGYMKLDLDDTVESQIAMLYMGDELAFDIDDLLTVDFWLKCSASLGAQVSLAFGMCSAKQDDPDSFAAHASFRLFGNNLILCETDDGTNDNDDIAAGESLSTTVKRFTIDFASGIKTVVPPPSVGGKGNVLFACGNTQGLLRPVARLTRFDMSNYSSGLQPYVILQKGLASSVIASVEASAWVKRIRIRHRVP